MTQAVAKLGMSQIPQKDLLETVRLREQVTTKRSKQELPPPPPPKKRQIPVDLEAKKKWELFCTWYINILRSVLILYWSLIVCKFKHNYCNGNSTSEPLYLWVFWIFHFILVKHLSHLDDFIYLWFDSENSVPVAFMDRIYRFLSSFFPIVYCGRI